MVTNSTEYQKAYQKEYRRTHPQKQYKKVKKGSKEVKNLHPPKMVEKSGFPVEVDLNTHLESIPPISSDDSKTIDFSNLDPGYQNWALSLETQRHYYYTKFGRVHRKNRIEVKKDLRVKNQELDMVELMKKSKVGLYRDCMNELKQVLEMRKK